MSERSTKSQRVQFGWETAYNTVAVANRRLLSLGFDLDPQITRRKNFAQGYNFPSSTSFEKDFSEATLTGAPMFDEIIVPLMLAFGQVTPVAGTPATALTWTWNVPLSGDITPRSATVERGDASTGERVKGVVVTGFDMNWTRDEITFSADAMGTNADFAATMATTGVTAYPQVPMNPNGVGIFLDSTSAGLGTTRLLRAFEGGMSFGNLFGQIWPLNETKQSFDGIVGMQPESESTITLMADTAGKALLANLRAGDRRFMRTQILGPTIGVGPATYKMVIDQAIEVVDVDAFEDADGIYAIPLTFAPVADETWAKAVSIAVTNTMTAATA